MPRAVELQRSAGLTTGRRGDQARDRWFLCLRFGLRTDRSAARALFGLLAPFIADARYHKAICPVAKLGPGFFLQRLAGKKRFVDRHEPATHADCFEAVR